VRAAAASPKTDADLMEVTKFVPFDPATKMSEAHAVDRDGNALRMSDGMCMLQLRARQISDMVAFTTTYTETSNQSPARG
jgi:hypothetical protein